MTHTVSAVAKHVGEIIITIIIIIIVIISIIMYD